MPRKSRIDAAGTLHHIIARGIAEGKREDLIGGGLVRSSDGWSAVKAMRSVKVFQKADERILGDGEFVERVLAETEDQLKRKYALQAAGVDLEQVAEKVCEILQLKSTELWAPGKQRRRVAVSLSVKRGEKLAQEKGYSLI